MKIVGMIPARMGSTRVKNKNIRLINEVPLIHYIVNAAIESTLLNEIYINSESILFSDIAKASGIEFYQRNMAFASDTATNDDFVLDFINTIECDILVQLLPTSPFISTSTINNFIKSMLDGKFETMISTSNVQIECLYEEKPINFDQKKQTPPSQLLKPIKAYACGLMAWDCKKFRSNMAKYGSAYHGGDGTIGFYDLKGYASIDIDNEEDFMIAEAVATALNKPKTSPKYYENIRQHSIETDREYILKKDGVSKNILNDYNKEVASINEIINHHGRNQSWSYTLVNSPSNCATLIAQMPGEGNRMHHHPTWDEWWHIIEGQWEWVIEGKRKLIKAGDVVYMERNRKHKITAVGDKMAIRLAVSRADVEHLYDNKDLIENEAVV